jgi:para-nitrobenzyl esterase
MIRYWTAFAQSDNPNGPGLPVWQPARNGDPTPFVLSLAPEPGGIGMVDVAKDHACEFWVRLDAVA